MLGVSALLLLLAVGFDPGGHAVAARVSAAGAEDWRLPSSAPSREIRGPEAGARIYAANCVACHQADGNGLPGIYPPLAGSEWLGEENRVVRLVLGGLSGRSRFAAGISTRSCRPFGACSQMRKLPRLPATSGRRGAIPVARCARRTWLRPGRKRGQPVRDGEICVQWASALPPDVASDLRLLRSGG